MSRFLSVLALSLAFSSAVAQVANGKLQIHQIDIGQGDGAVLITPNGAVVLFDAGRDIAKQKTCSSEIDYLDQLGVQQIDYIFVSHYHDDHIGCIPEIIERFPLQHESYDRGSEPVKITASYNNYVAAVGQHRKAATLDQVVTLDPGSGAEVTLKVIALNGSYKGNHVNAKDENDVSLSVLVSFDGFREEIGGDLSGEKTGMYVDVETGAETEAGSLDVYKVHHHCSSHSSNENWLQVTKPTVAIISTGDKNRYHHPAPDCIQRLHEADVSKVYWTEEGNGEPPKSDDVVGGDIVVEVPAHGRNFTVSHNDGMIDTFEIKAPTSQAESLTSSAGATSEISPAPRYAWSKKSRVYHEIDCPAVERISQANLVTSVYPPTDKEPSSCIKNRHPQ